MPRTDPSLRLGRALLVITLLIGFLAPSASGSAAAPDFVDHQAWSASGPLAPADASDSIYVSAAADQEQARAFIDLGVASLSAPVLEQSTLFLEEAPSSTGAAQARVRACALRDPLKQDGRIEGLTPAIDCDVAQPVERDAGGMWSVDLSPFAASLRTGDIAGIALLPQPGEVPPQSFTVAFDTTRTRVRAPSGATAGAPRTTSPAQVDGPTERPEAGTPTDGEPADVAGLGAEQLVADAQAAPLAGDGSGPTSSEVLPPELASDLRQSGGVAGAPTSSALSTAAAKPVGSSRLPGVLVVLVLMMTAAVLLRGRRSPLHSLGDLRPPVRLLTSGVAVLGVPAALLLLTSETTTYKFGVVAIVFIAAIGLHILVNTTGEVSLAHAAFLGIPAFAAARVSAEAGLNPVLAVPVAVGIGGLIGAVVALTALRARGLQVALATLAVAIATVQYLWVQEWLVGPPEGWAIPNPSVFGQELETSKSRTPVLVVLVVLAVAAGTGILRSKLGRALSLLRSSPDVAAAAGVPVAMYRALAYALAGAFAGLAGGAYVIWVQQVTPQAFPLQLGFTYLLVAALAGRGGLAGVAVAALIVQAGALFSFLPQSIALYVAPLALIVQITRFEGGINASLRDLRARIQTRFRSKTMDVTSTSNEGTASPTAAEVTGIRLPAAVGTLMVVAGFGAIMLAWYNAGNTSQLWIQNQYIVSGSVTGIGLIITGCALLLRDALLTGSSIVRGRVALPASDSEPLDVPTAPQVAEEPEVVLPAQSRRADSPVAGESATRRETSRSVARAGR